MDEFSALFHFFDLAIFSSKVLKNDVIYESMGLDRGRRKRDRKDGREGGETHTWQYFIFVSKAQDVLLWSPSFP